MSSVHRHLDSVSARRDAMGLSKVAQVEQQALLSCPRQRQERSFELVLLL